MSTPNQPTDPPALTGTAKAAVVLVQLPRDVAADVLRHLPNQYVDPIVNAIANLGTVPKPVRDDVIHETETLLRSLEQIVEGGWDAAWELLESAYGPQRAQDVLRRLTQQQSLTAGGRSFTRLSHSPPEHIAALIADEMPQTVAIVLAHLDSRLAAQVLAVLPEDLAAAATRRLARMETLAPAVVQNLERTLESRLALTGGSELGGGLELVVPVLNATDTQREQAILERIAEQDPGLAQDIRNQLFTFSDLMTLDDPTLQTL
ncbi:MAG: FliG C-terminal domain-containing protein, partial [Clostridia bacterium]